jgi:hypothetical protein
MKNQPTLTMPTTQKTLDHLVSLLTTSVLPTAVRKKSFIVNEVPGELHIVTDENMLASILSSLLHTVVNHTENSCIRIAASGHGNIILVHMKESGNFNNYSVANDLQQIQSLAKKIGGCISISDRRENTTTIAFSFPNIPQSAT